MKRLADAGFSLVELIISMAIAAIVGSILLSAMFSFQSGALAAIKRDDLHKRAGHLLRFAVDDLRDTALLTGARPQTAVGSALTLSHDSLAGDPVELISTALLPESGGATGHDAITFVKAVSFTPAIRLAETAEAGATCLVLDRRPNQAPGSSREIIPAPEAISHVVLDNQKGCYQVLGTGQSLPLATGLRHQAPAGSEVHGVRAHRLFLQPFEGSNRFYRDDFTSREILDEGIDGMQLEYLMSNGLLVDDPVPLTDVRGIRINLLVRSRKPDPDFLDRRSYQLGDRSYGPYFDHFRRVLASELVEVKNYALP